MKSGLLHSAGPDARNVGAKDDNLDDIKAIYTEGKKQHTPAASEAKKNYEAERIVNPWPSPDNPQAFVWAAFLTGVSGPQLVARHNFSSDYILKEQRKFQQMNGIPRKLLKGVLDLMGIYAKGLLRRRVLFIRSRNRKFVTSKELEELISALLLELDGSSSVKHAKQDSVPRVINPVGSPAGYPWLDDGDPRSN